MEDQREKLILSGVHNAKYIARKIHSELPTNAVDLDDLLQVAMLAVVQSYDRYDATKSCTFRTFSGHRAYGACIDYLRSIDAAPRNARKLVRKAEELKMRHPDWTEEQVSCAAGISVSAMRHFKQRCELADSFSLDSGLCVEGERLVGDTIASETMSPEQACILADATRHMNKAIVKLPTNQRIVLRKRYVDDMTMKQTGKLLGVVESRVSQIHSKAIQTLRTALHA